MSLAILLSGGLDSTALAFWKKPQTAFTIDYGQRAARAEVRAATTICRELGVSHEVIAVDCGRFGSGDLAGLPPNPHAPSSEWWPFRNQLLITIAAMRAITLAVDELMVGSVITDALHADGTIGFFEKANELLSMQEGGIRVTVPAIHMTTVQLVRAAGIDIRLLAWAHSCHVANFACGSCRGCLKHRSTMMELGLEPY
jgi:7-cyano-7-deazaguanine synthase